MARCENEIEWNELRIETLRDLKAAGRSHAQIADAMGTTRSAISGGSRRFCKDIPAKPSGKPPLGNHLSRFGAEKLAHNIKMHWAEQGYKVKCSVEKVKASPRDGDSSPIYAVKTDMINGLPRDYRGAS